MVTITLTNNNLDSKNTSVSINLISGTCCFPDKSETSLKQFIKQKEFTHPLLSEPFKPTTDNVYHYEFDNTRELFYAAIFVYKTLLHVDKPQLCSFKINPSKNYQHLKVPEDLGFSINSSKFAQERISIEQFNSIVSEIQGIKFEFSEDLIIDDTFTIDELPVTVNGDLFYVDKEHLIQLLEHPTDLSRLEVRFVNPLIGFGVFSKTEIPEQQIVGVYSGVKTANKPQRLNFAYKPEEDSLNMIIDGKYFGNITRFVNHAPDPDDHTETIEHTGKLVANSKAHIYYINGISIIIHITNRAVKAGEQLLVSYGESYFKDYTPVRFKSNGRPFKTFRNFSKNKIMQLRIMANNGVRKAEIYLKIRLAIIIAAICLIMAGLQFIPG